MTKARLLLLALPVFILFVLFSFLLRSSIKENPIVQEKPRIAATIFPLYDMVRNIAGETVEVDLILEPGASPHTFEPTPQIIRKTQEAKKIFFFGYGLDEWALDLVSDPSVFMRVDQGISLRTGDDREPVDPHYWLTAQNAILISKTIASSLKQTFPEQSEQFDANLDAWILKLEKLDVDIKNQLSTVTNKTLITFHDAWFYFADAYGLTIAETFEPTVGREPTPQHLAKLSEVIKQTGVKTLYAEPQFSSIGLKAFLTGQNINIAALDPEGSKNSLSYIDLMYQNAVTIAQNQ